MKVSSVFICIVLTILINENYRSCTCLKISCKTENAEDVDWFYLYKLPKNLIWLPGDSKFKDSSGLNYMYIQSDAIEKKWIMSTKLLNESDSFPGQTLNGLFTNESILVVAYNDEPTSGKTDGFDGHTKGILASDGQTAIWLIHSVPKYPTISQYTYPTSGEHYGQNFLCITVDAIYLHKIGSQLIFNEANIYFSHIPSKMANLYPNIEDAISKKWRTFPPYSNKVTIKSLNGTTFKSFAKGRKFHKELYSDWIAPEFDISLYVETWRNGAGGLPSNCTGKQKVYNVNKITAKQLGFTFNSSSDHSKWAVCTNSSWICAGDINRVSHQLARGGGTVCQNSFELANMYRELIGGYEDCLKSCKSYNFLENTLNIFP